MEQASLAQDYKQRRRIGIKYGPYAVSEAVRNSDKARDLDIAALVAEGG
jgi:hypothetical protein